MKCYAAPYEGEQEYIFFSYCHDNAAQVYPVIERLALEGFRVWYDDGIHPGEDWPQVIAEHLSRASVCVAAVSRASAESHNCRNEVSFAVANNKPFLSIVLEEFKMPLGMKLQLSSARFLKLFEQSAEAFYEALLTAPFLAACRTHGVHADAAALNAWKKHTEEYSRQKDDVSSASALEDAGFHWFWEEGRQNTAKESVEGNRFETGKSAFQKKGVGDVPEGVREAPEYSFEIPQTEEACVYPEAERLKAETEARRRQVEKSDGTTPDSLCVIVASEQPEVFNEDEDKTVAIIKDSPEEPTVTNIPYTPALLIRTKTGEVFSIKNEQTVIGRTKSKVDVVVSGNKAVSGKHAVIRKVGNCFALYNLKPTNETVVDGRDLAHDECVDLNPGSEIFLADEQFFLVYGEVYDRVFDEQRLCLLQCRETGETRILAEDRIPLNRNHPWKNEILSDKRISRTRHAEIFWERGRLYLRDLGSKNGTFLNGKQLSPQETAELHDGDIVAVSETEFVFSEIRIGA